MEKTEIPDFLRFNKHGTILTPDERRRVAEARGVCITCGQVTHVVTAFRRKPLENEHVHNGICLICNTEERVVADWKRAAAATDSMLTSRRKKRDDYRGKKKLMKSITGSKSLKVVGSNNASSTKGKERKSASAPDISEDYSDNDAAAAVDATTTSILSRSTTVDSTTSSQDDAWDILREMRSNPQNIPLLTLKCCELGKLPSTSEGSMYEIIDVMNRFPSESGLQRAGLLALWSFVVVGGHDVKMEAVDADILDVVIQSMGDLENEDIVCLGMGIFSSLAEGLGVRTKMLEEEAVEVVEMVLAHSLEGDTYNPELLYWILRCLVSLLAVTKEHEDFVKEKTFIECELLVDLEAIDDIKELLLKGDTVHNVLLALQETDNAECFSLQLGMEFLISLFSNCNTAKCDEKDEGLFFEICRKAVDIEQPQIFPIMKNLACTCLCFLVNNGSIKSMTTKAESISSVDGFITTAVGVVRMKRQKDETVRDVMMCTLSHIFYCMKTINDFPHSNSIIKACLAVMSKEKSNSFIQETGLWILWGILAATHEVDPSKSLVNEVLDAAKEAMSDSGNTDIITLGIAIIADIAVWHKILVLEDTLQSVLNVQSKHSENSTIVAEGNRFLVSACRSKAAIIDSKRAGVASIDLLYKLAKINRNSEFPLDELINAIEAWKQSMREPDSAAKILFLLVNRTYNSSADSAESNGVIEFIVDILRYADNTELHNYACMALCSISESYHQIWAMNDFDLSGILGAIIEAQHNGLKQLCAIWALMILDAEISSSILNDLALYLVNTISEHFASNREIVSASIAVLSIVLVKSRPVSQEKRATVERAIGAVIRVMYDCLDRAGDSPQIFLFGLRCLRLCAVDAFLHDCIVKEGGIVAILDGMNVNHDNEQIQEEGCNIIRHIASGSIETKMLVIEADGVDVVLNILDRFGAHSRLVSEALEITLYLSISKQIRSFIASQGGLLMITSIMNALASDAVVQEKALKALADLISDIDNDSIEMADIASAVNTTVFNHLAEASIQAVGIAILRNLSKRSESIREKLLNSGCCDTVITAITIHMTRPKIISSSIATLVNLSDTEQCKRAINYDALELICHAMMVNLNCQKTQMLGCKLLCLTSSAIEISTSTIFVETIVYAMLNHYASEYIQLSGCELLSTFSYHCRYIQDFSDLDSKMVEVVIASMENFPSRPKLQECAIVALESFLSNQKLLSALRARSSRVTHLVNEAMTLSDSVEIFERGDDIIRVFKS